MMFLNTGRELSVLGVHALCALVSGGFVCSLYLVPSRVKALPRNNPEHISYRLRISCIVTILFYVAMYLSAIRLESASFSESVGLSVGRLAWSLLLTVALMSIFYAGPIMTTLALIATKTQFELLPSGELGNEHEKPKSFFSVLIDQMQGYWDDNGMMIFLRNLVAAPITEELVFRGLLVPLLTLGYASIKDESGAPAYSPFSVMIRCPLWFALAHVHHLIERIRTGEKVSFAVIGTILQMTYTSIFGCIAAGLLMRTGNIYAPIASHMFCNYWGLPDIGFMFPPTKNRTSDLAFMYPYRYLLLAMHALGLIVFSAAFVAVTEPLAKESIFYKVFNV